MPPRFLPEGDNNPRADCPQLLQGLEDFRPVKHSASGLTLSQGRLCDCSHHRGQLKACRVPDPGLLICCMTLGRAGLIVLSRQTILTLRACGPHVKHKAQRSLCWISYDAHNNATESTLLLFLSCKRGNLRLPQPRSEPHLCHYGVPVSEKIP